MPGMIWQLKMSGLKPMIEPDIITGDALEELKKIADDSVDLVIADPPYNLGKNYGNNIDKRTFEDYLDFSRNWLTETKRILKPTGSIYVFMGFRFISYLYNIFEQELQMHFNGWITWHYTQGIGRTKGFSPRHDDILLFTKTDNFKFNLDSVRVPQKYFRERNNMRGANPGDVWEFSHVHYCNSNRQNHPTQKPEGVVERMVLASSDENDFVVDPFAGSGTTLRVCQQTNRRCLGIEINPTFVSMIQTRLSSPFNGFDSIDPRMERVPMDLHQENVRNDYLDKHKQWFLTNHQNAEVQFESIVTQIYGKTQESQKSLFDISE